MSLYLTYDIGTTSLKTALVRDDGAVLAVHVSEYTLRTPQPEWAEMLPSAYWDAAVEGTQTVLAQSGESGAAVAAIGFSSQGQTFIPIAVDGRELHDAIVWVDNRAQGIADRWAAEWLSLDKHRQSSGYPWILAGLMPYKIAWLAEHAPQAHRAWKFLCLPDYLIYRLTGEIATDYVTAIFSGLYDLRTGAWNRQFIAAAGITSDQLPTILSPGSVAGQVTPDTASMLGIRPGIPVCVGANDQLAGALGAGNVCPGTVTETTGTALAAVVTTENLLDSTLICVGRHPQPDCFYGMTYAITSAIVLKWFRDLCADCMDYGAFLAGAEAVPPGCDGLTVLPHFTGTGAPTFNPQARGVFAGLSFTHSRAHLARAIMEACACLLQECLEPFDARQVTVVRSLGGAARSDLWLQMKADLLGVPVERPACADAASLGAAMLAAAGTGQFSSIREASEAWYRPADTFTPNDQHYRIYRDVYARYRELYQKLYG